MDKTFFLEKFAELFEDTDPAEITLETPFKDLDEWSSLMALSVIAMCDEEFEVKIKGDDIRQSTTVEDLYNRVAAKK